MEPLQRLGASKVLLADTVEQDARPLERGQFAAAIDNVGGAVLSWLLRSRCRLLDLDRLHELQTAQEAGSIGAKEFVQAWLLGWDEAEVRDAADAPMRFTPENLAQLLKVPGAAVAMTRAFYSGYEEAAEKNSGPLPATS